MFWNKKGGLLKAGDKAPDFTVVDHEGRAVKLADWKGQRVLLYWYPKADTPGCTAESCGFRDHHSLITDVGRIYGVSFDTPADNKAFAQKYKLPFPLLSDPDRKLMQAWGAYGEKMMYGKKTTGVIRSTAWIGPDGVVRKHWARVADAAKHPAAVLEAIRAGE